jgi:hypothetical protein
MCLHTIKKRLWNATYQVTGGDSIYTVAARFNCTWHEIYTVNQGIIDTTAYAFGKAIPGGPWENLYPGEVLIVPSD